MMSNEEWDRKAEFLLNQQAKFDADMARLEAAQAESAKRLDRLEEFLSSQATIMFEGLKVLRETQKLTEEALRRLILRFDRHLTEGHPGVET